MTSPFLSPSELSELLRVSLKWTYQQLNRGNIPGALKISGVWLINKEILMDGLKQKAQKPDRIKAVTPKNGRHGL